MGWRTVVLSSSSKVDYQMGFLVVRSNETVKIHINEIETLIVESTAVSLTAALLCELIKQKVKVVFCDEKRNPQSELVSYYGSHDTSMKVRSQITWTDDIKKLIWTEIVTEKIRNQAKHLAYWHLSEEKLLIKYIDEIKLADETNREGHAAKVYFNALFGKDFSRNEDSSVNAALNYGYTLILSMLNRCIVANGYLTQLGIFHDNMYNPFNLGSDLMEPFRPLVDYDVKCLMPVKFEHDEKRRLLSLMGNEVIIDGKKEYLNNAIKIYCKSVFDAINDKDSSLIKFFKYEL